MRRNHRRSIGCLNQRSPLPNKITQSANGSSGQWPLLAGHAMSGLRISHLSVALLMSYIKSQGFSAALAISVLESLTWAVATSAAKASKGKQQYHGATVSAGSCIAVVRSEPSVQRTWTCVDCDAGRHSHPPASRWTPQATRSAETGIELGTPPGGLLAVLDYAAQQRDRLTPLTRSPSSAPCAARIGAVN
jgi:hypothetical protein